MKIPPIMGAAMRFITSAPAGGSHDWDEPKEHARQRHDFRSDAPDSAVHNRFLQTSQARQTSNPFDYLTEFQRHPTELAANPSAWMPWNYPETTYTCQKP